MIAPPSDASTRATTGEERLGDDGHVVGVGVEQVSPSRRIPTWPFQKTRSPRAARPAPSGRPSSTACMSELRGAGCPAARSASWTRRRAVDAAGAAPAPEIGHAEEALGLGHEVAGDRRRGAPRGTKPPPRSAAKPPLVPQTRDLGEEGQVVRDPCPDQRRAA